MTFFILNYFLKTHPQPEPTVNITAAVKGLPIHQPDIQVLQAEAELVVIFQGRRWQVVDIHYFL